MAKVLPVLLSVSTLMGCGPSIKVSPPLPERRLPPVPAQALVPCRAPVQVQPSPDGTAGRAPVATALIENALSLAECEMIRQLLVKAWPKAGN